MRPRARGRLAPYLFVGPFVAVFAVFFAYPLVRSFVLSLHQTDGTARQRFVGAGNYAFLIHDRYFWLATVNTLAYVTAFLVVQIPLSLGLALLLNSRRVRLRAVFRFAFFSTYLVGQVFVAILFGQLLDPHRGPIHQWTGLEIGFLTHPVLARVAVLVAWLWLSVGFGMIYFLAALQGVNAAHYEAAAVDGAGRLSRFWHVTLPSIQPVTMFLLIAGTISGLQLFDLPYVLFPSGAGPGQAGLTIVTYLLLCGFQVGNLGYAAAIGWALVVMTLVIAGVQWKLGGIGDDA